MAHDDRYGNRDREHWRRPEEERERGRWGGDNERGGQRPLYDRGYGRDPDDRSPGSHTDYYRGGDRGQARTGPEGGFESRSDYRRTERHADQGRSWGVERNEHADRDRGDRDRDNREFSDRGHGGSQSSFSGSGGVNQGMGAYGGNRGSGYAGGTDDSAGWSTGGGAGPGYAPEFSGGPRFDRADVGSVGTHGAHPVASPYGEAQTGYGGGGAAGLGGSGSSARSRAILQQHEREHGGQSHGSGGERQSHHDPHYSEWRRRQIEQLDRDYHEYRTENASRFESEFGSWREKRGQQRQSLVRCAKNMKVVGSDGEHVGTIDEIANDRIILAKSDENAGGHHHSIPCSWIDKVDDKVTINKTSQEAMKAWRDEETSRALFEDRNSGSDGPHILERSFSGTYDDENR